MPDKLLFLDWCQKLQLSEQVRNLIEQIRSSDPARPCWNSSIGTNTLPRAIGTNKLPLIEVIICRQFSKNPVNEQSPSQEKIGFGS
jgi:hypothetical protein